MLSVNKSKICFAFLILFLIPMGASAEVIIDDHGFQYLSDKIIVTVDRNCPGLNEGEFHSAGYSTGLIGLDNFCKKNGVIKIERWYKGKIRHALHLKRLVERMYIFTIGEAYDVKGVVNAIVRNENIEYAELYNIPTLCYIPNDPVISRQWALGKIKAYKAWDITRGEVTRNVVIGIVDSGIYYNHPDIEPNMWINAPEDINGNGRFDPWDENQGGDYNNQDDDGNGYVDDVCGYDFAMGDPNPIEDIPTHGTAVAGAASEATDNGIGGAGAGFSTRLIAAKGYHINGYMVGVYQALIYCVDQGADFVTCCWGGYSYSQFEENLINNAFYDGCLVVAGAGNDNRNSPFYPAAYELCLGVAATDSNDVKTSFSNYGDWVDICAPGVDIYTTWGSDSYTTMLGTSFAAPICAGAAALIKAQDLNREPQEIIYLLSISADSASLYTANPGYEGLLGWGRVDAYAAQLFGLYTYVFMNPDDPPIEVPAGSLFTYEGVIINGTALWLNTDVWTKVKLPGGSMFGPLDLWNNIWIEPHSLVTHDAEQFVPEYAPAGDYLYIAYKGNYPRSDDSAYFGFSVTTITHVNTDGDDWGTEQWEDMDNYADLPVEVSLSDNYPNPFNSSTTITFNVPNAGDVNLEIYNILGQRVETSVGGFLPAGRHTVTWDASGYSSGLYFYKLTVGDKVFTKRMTLLK